MRKVIFLLLFVISFCFSNSLSEIREKGVVRIGVFDGQPPFSSFKNGSYEGFEIDFANELAKRIFGNKGGKVEFHTTYAKNRIEDLETNKVDIILATLTINDERAKRVDFSMPYFSVNIGILTKKADNIKKSSDLAGKKILVENGTTAQAFYQKRGFDTETCPSSNECYKQLKDRNDVYGYANDNLIVLAYPVIDRGMEVNIKNLGTSDFLGLAVQKGNKELLEFLNQTLINLSKEHFFSNAFKNTIDPFYKGTAEEKYFLLDDIYRIFG
ncbi:amino acid ABC transporter, periplasmic cysteine-binding protein [Campylobacter blaseri]|uniref:Amino acid ABC transporter substrate-binding protein n=1 Tax=Campylobacter blaseri TaxID=2042961 RepID=A0A2P8R0E6_9BACT|nr:transporter substrate-binding domain-containing protein [Campylobacter blaseri]PSM51975.1 amino acid ABC transporter substrate-binding protein [Campylobacter blaseri]PSM53760.1 amino acid ABC transporter substrate-binding protein [Campylobacter blaseri]QKF85686.1 amino acid ABC transporter, periplasmic cysteine-binding protein [Campylobacter blaseri]